MWGARAGVEMKTLMQAPNVLGGERTEGVYENIDGGEEREVKISTKRPRVVG